MIKWREFFLSQSRNVVDAKPITFRHSNEKRCQSKTALLSQSQTVVKLTKTKTKTKTKVIA